MDQAQLEALLGRPLTAVEVANRELYLEIANETLESMLCTPIAPASGTRAFDVREGYRTAFIDIYTTITEVKINDTVIDVANWSKRQWDKRYATWYNSIVLDKAFTRTQTVITVTGTWGFTDMPADLQAVLAGLFDLITKKNKLNSAIKSKQVEDFRITFADGVNLDADFAIKYESTIDKYSLCDVGYVRNGRVC